MFNKLTIAIISHFKVAQSWGLPRRVGPTVLESNLSDHPHHDAALRSRSGGPSGICPIGPSRRGCWKRVPRKSGTWHWVRYNTENRTMIIFIYRLEHEQWYDRITWTQRGQVFFPQIKFTNRVRNGRTKHCGSTSLFTNIIYYAIDRHSCCIKDKITFLSAL